MKIPVILLGAALVASISAGAWLYTDNAALRGLLAEQSPPPGVKPRAKTASPIPAKQPLNAPPGRVGTTASNGSADGPRPAQKALPAGAAPSAFAVSGNEDGTVTVTDPASGISKVLTMADLAQLQQDATAAAMEHSIKRPGGPSWSPGQAAGAPDTQQHGDYSTAWASESPDGGREWLMVKYSRAVEVGEINIHESYNPGAVTKVSAMMPDGSERVIWEGTGTPDSGIVERAVKVPPGIRSDQIRIELDTARVPGWNEIDAVELVGRDGSRQWAAESTASSYFGQGRPGAFKILQSGFIGNGLEVDSFGVMR